MAREKPIQVATLEQTLKRFAIEGELYEKLPDGKVHCFACGHRCVILPGLEGVCKVRYNEGGRLYVPANYVGALNCDPIEKKPFFHVLPGTRAMTFGMLGCDLHCSYCFSADTVVLTNKGPLTLEELYAQADRYEETLDGFIAHVRGVKVIAKSGKLQSARKVFKHYYSGPVVTVRAYYLPALRCTPDHRIYATPDPSRKAPELIQARELTQEHYLVVPKKLRVASSLHSIDVYARLSQHQPKFRVPRCLTPEQVEDILEKSNAGSSSRQLAEQYGKDASYIRHVRSKARRGLWKYERVEPVRTDGNRTRSFKERRPGIPAVIELDKKLAKLLGYYCAEGSVAHSKDRPNSHGVVFSFGPSETQAIEEATKLITEVFDIRPRLVKRSTTTALELGKASAALLFQELSGNGAGTKHVPLDLYESPPEVIRSFLDGYIKGDGHRYENGKVSATTISHRLAYGVAALCLKLGYFPSLYVNKLPLEKTIEGRMVKQAERQYTVVRYDNPTISRKLKETDDYYFVPVRSVTREDFAGYVYNMEVEEERSYLANLVAVSNCQNYITSQALRDPIAGAPPEAMTAERMVVLARRYGAASVISSYNEPLITSEWAVAIFKEAKKSGFLTGYVSNGNATLEVLSYIRPWAELYKIDLKSFNDRNYRKLGGTLNAVLDTCRMVYEKGFWLEIVTLVIPGFNDSDEELREMARFIAEISPDIPWHVTAFHKDYKMTDPDNTPPSTLMRAAEIGLSEGLCFVYAGNLPGFIGRFENTYCPDCQTLLVERFGFRIKQINLQGDSCPKCQRRIPGVWRLTETAA